MKIKSQKINNHVIGLLNALPVLLPSILASFGVVAMFFLLIGKFRSEFIWPVGILVSLPIVRAVYRSRNTIRPGSNKEQRLIDIVVVIGVFVWLLLNVNFTSQNIFVYRDPAIYSVAGAWLSRNDNLNIKRPSVFGKSEVLTATGAGFGASTRADDQIYAQGQHLLPAYLGLVGGALGSGAMLHANVLFGATALLALYGFARLFMKPKWAALAVLVMAISLPMLYFSRDTYTEPLAATFTFGALALLWIAQKNKKARLLWFIAGLTAGAGALTRIDAYITLAGLLGFMIIFLSLSKKQERKHNIAKSGLFAIGALFSSLVGWLDLVILSSGYYVSLAPRFKVELLLLLVIIIVGILAVTLSWRTGIIKNIDKRTKNWRAPAAYIAIILLAGFFMSRPLWLVSHHSKHIPLVAGLQGAAKNPVDDSRDYAEQTANWIAWYIGPVMAISGVAGLAIAARKVFDDDDGMLLVPGLAVVVGTAIVFLNRPSITPDQIWASRRLLPVILPGMAIYGAFALSRVAYQPKLNKYFSKSIWGLVVLSILLPPLFISYPYLRTRTYVPQLAQVDAICDALPKKAAIIWLGETRSRIPVSSRAFCDVEAVGAASLDKASLKDITKKVNSKGYKLYVGVQSEEANVILPPDALVSEISSIRYQTVPVSLYHPPRRVLQQTRSISIGLVYADGRVTPVN